jgi:hypothetical protein
VAVGGCDGAALEIRALPGAGSEERGAKRTVSKLFQGLCGSPEGLHGDDGACPDPRAVITTEVNFPDPGELLRVDSQRECLGYLRARNTFPEHVNMKARTAETAQETRQRAGVAHHPAFRVADPVTGQGPKAGQHVVRVP